MGLVICSILGSGFCGAGASDIPLLKNEQFTNTLIILSAVVAVLIGLGLFIGAVIHISEKYQIPEGVTYIGGIVVICFVGSKIGNLWSDLERKHKDTKGETGRK